jgi:hypothetical protein
VIFFVIPGRLRSKRTRNPELVELSGHHIEIPGSRFARPGMTASYNGRYISTSAGTAVPAWTRWTLSMMVSPSICAKQA